MKLKKLLIVLASMTLFACAFVGCKKVEQIDVLKKDMPQLVYVEGSDLNLATGKLTAEIKGELVEIPLNDPSVVVSGYDKNKLGEQILTITYEEKTTTIKINVVPRIAVDKFESAYFVGEPFNYDKGELVITNDDGTNFTVPMNDETVTLSGFSSESANSSLPVTVVYEKDSVSYSGTFNVSVHDVTTVEFKAPNKKEYDNHETALDVSGGYISLKNADGTLVRYQVLTTDMVRGFDLAQATLAHRETPLTQTLTVEYLGNEKSYDIQIRFSDLSLIKLRAEEMKDLKFTDEQAPAGCTAEMGKNALEAMEVYFEMSDDEKTDITEAEIQAVAKVAATYGLGVWKQAFESYKDAFYLKDGGLYWDCADFEKTKVVYTNLKAKNPVIYEDSLVLKKLETDFADTVIVPAVEDDEEDLTIADILSAVYSTETMDEFAGQLGLMIELYESLKDVPKDWTSDALKTTYKTQIEATWVILRETEYTHVRFRNLYALASRWREKNDLFEILYDYYYDEEVLDDDNNVSLSKISAFKDFRLPGKLETLYTYLYNAKTQAEYMINGYQYKSEDFLYNYEKALKLQADILQNGSEMEKDLYNRLKFDYLISDGQNGFVLYSFDGLFNLFRRTTMGYLYHFNAYVNVPEFENLWAQLLSVMDSAMVGGEAYYETEDFARAVENMLEAYFMLSPIQQVKFMHMLNPFYAPLQGGSRFPAKVWDDSETSYNGFVFFVYKYYRSVLPESTHDAFRQFMLAAESLANTGLTPYVMQEFTQGMQTVADYLDAVDEADKQVFLNKMGYVYDPYYELATVKFADLENPVIEDLGEWEDEFDELYTILTEAYFTIELNKNFQQNQRTTIVLSVLSAYEKAEMIANKILQSGEESVMKAYCFDIKTKDMVIPGGAPVTLGGTADFLMYYIREEYMALLRNSLFTADTLLLDYYNDINTENENGVTLKEFLTDAHYLYYTFVNWNTVGSSDVNHIFYDDVDQVMKVLSTYRTLSVDQQHYISALDQYGMYRNSMVRFAKEQGLSSDAQIVVGDLMNLEYIYTFYQKYPDMEDEDGNSYLSMLDEMLQNLLEDYYYLEKDASGADVEKFHSYFGETYTYYLQKCKDAGLNVEYTPAE
ncbi:MAG: hypothetical protein E7381_01415 [Clostridiales bacterium]|nr:hypothetical protein [Clostridiales bacterium]